MDMWLKVVSQMLPLWNVEMKSLVKKLKMVKPALFQLPYGIPISS